MPFLNIMGERKHAERARYFPDTSTMFAHVFLCGGIRARNGYFYCSSFMHIPLTFTLCYPTSYESKSELFLQSNLEHNFVFIISVAYTYESNESSVY